MPEAGQLDSSFRDPSGFLFLREGNLYRQVNQVYAKEYNQLMQSGLYERLVKRGLLIAHEESSQPAAQEGTAFKIIQPERVPFISYPYEWSFSQLKDAALATLSIQRRALKAGMTLKDASSYNMQFVRGRPALIDTLSFEAYREGKPWDAYRQFCQHFLAPLALMAHADVRLGQLLRVHIDGIPLDLASRLLPAGTRLNFGLLTHIHLHAGAQKRYAAGIGPADRRGSISRDGLLGLIESLEATVRKLAWKPGGTEWGDYYQGTNYSDAAFEHKKDILRHWLAETRPGVVWDLGANTGMFSRLASASGAFTVAWDVDPAAVEEDYRQVKAEKSEDLLPLLIDLTNPSPSLGWAGRERDSLESRGPADMVLALALIHHLAISNNVPLAQAADFFASLGKRLIIEFVPKGDSQVRRLLSSRADIFPDYTREGFEAAFSRRFKILHTTPVHESERLLYLMEIC
ncbi:MAG: SAM-dependent methyltransferase [Bacteroidota bacterium]